jgi:AraC-like DNA-binding protein
MNIAKLKQPDDLPGVPSHERHFYMNHSAFGRFGMRLFEPEIMPHPHWHGHIEVNVIKNGTMEYDLDGAKLVVPENRAAIFWAGIPHQLTNIMRTNEKQPLLANLYLPLDAFLFMQHIGQLQVSILGGGFGLLGERLCDADQMQQWYSDYRSRDFERVSVLKSEFNTLLRRAQIDGIDWLHQPLADTRGERVIPTAHIRHVVEMVRFILDNLADPITNSDVAAVTGLHKNYALSLFTQTMRLPMKRFIIRMRLQRARSLLLESSMAINVVATESGFTSISQFYQHFKSAYGLSPHSMRILYAQMTLK